MHEFSDEAEGMPQTTRLVSRGLFLITEKSTLLNLDIFLPSFLQITQRNAKIYVSLNNRILNEFMDRNCPDSYAFGLIQRFYSLLGKRSDICLDFRLILDNFKDPTKYETNLIRRLDSVDKVILDSKTYLDQCTSQLCARLGPKCKILPQDFIPHREHSPDISRLGDFNAGSFNGVVLGGTFDRLHIGHKFLLSVAALLAKNYVTCGVTDGAMSEHKVLFELMEPISQRIEVVKKFLDDIVLDIACRIVPIYDPFGPSTTDEDLEAIVVSRETVRGANRVNEERLKRGLKKLEVFIVDLIDDDIIDSNDERKISSSKLRKSLLGRLIRRPVHKPHLSNSPYIIGLTGGICSGKTHIAGYLGELGAKIIDCDKLGHEAYAIGTNAYKRIVEGFGSDLIDRNNDNAINRKLLGSKVFSDKKLLEKLNSIVWPEIRNLAELRIKECKDAPVVVLDAAVLIEAGWTDMVHEVWVPIVPPSEVVQRLKQRNNLSEEQAWQRIKSQISNSERVSQANIVFCSSWEYSYTKAQVKQAWDDLLNRIHDNKTVNCPSFG